MMRFFLFLLAAAGSCYPQVEATVSLSNGIQLSIAARSNNGAPVALSTSLEPASGDSFYRIFRDENNLAVFAYKLDVARTDDGKSIRVTANPATDAFAARYPDADGGKPTPTFSATLESPPLGSGEKFSIAIPTAPELGQQLTDVVQVVMNQPGKPAPAAGPTRIRFSALKVSIGGQLASPVESGASVEGRYVMFYIPGRGGYFFSANASEPAPFVNIGLVRGEQLTFNVDNEMYDCSAAAPILVDAEHGQLWVYHDPNYKPGGNWTKTDLKSSNEEFFTAASDSMKWWMR